MSKFLLRKVDWLIVGMVLGVLAIIFCVVMYPPAALAVLLVALLPRR